MQFKAADLQRRILGGSLSLQFERLFYIKILPQFLPGLLLGQWSKN